MTYIALQANALAIHTIYKTNLDDFEVWSLLSSLWYILAFLLPMYKSFVYVLWET